jgi:predicted PurR-regulated permease PerM
MLINVPLELGLGIIAGLMAFIPLVGPFLALIPAFLVALLQSPEAALSVTLLYLLVQGADNYILTPIVVKETIRMPPALIIVAQMVLGVLFGRIGLIVAAPLAAATMTLTQLVYVEDFLQRGHATDD